MVKSLNSLKNTLHKGSQIEILFHWRTESHGRIREVTITNTQGFYSVVKDEPEHRDSLANNGKGTVLWWSNAPFGITAIKTEYVVFIAVIPKGQRIH